jgi:hypothetical protein
MLNCRKVKNILILIILLNIANAFEYQSGWPQYPAGGVDFSSPVLVDLNGDDTLDVLIASQSHQVYVWNHQGELYPNWPQPTQGISELSETSSPAVGDIDNDGQNEIVYSAEPGRLYAWEIDGSIVPGFPVNLGDRIIRLCTTLEDIDGDDSLEILTGTGNTQFQFFVYRHDGTLMWSKYTDAAVHSTPATGDIDFDGDIEIIVGNDGVNPQNCVYAWHHDGSTVNGWPKICGHHVDPSPALADIDNDGDYEIFFGSLDNYLYGVNHNNEDLPGWPNLCGSGLIEGIVSSPAIGDIDNDSILEVVTGRGIMQSVYGAIYAFKITGEPMNGFPINMTTGSVVSSPALADIDEDNDLEIIVGCQDGKLYGFHHNGDTVAGFPIEVGYPITSSPAIGDIDLDGDIEIAIGARLDSLYIWDLPGLYNPDKTPWPMFHHDPRHTGRLPLGIIGIKEINPVMNSAKYSASLSNGIIYITGTKNELLYINIFDIIGRKIISKNINTNSEGKTSINIQSQPAGIYFINIQESNRPRNETYKLIKI